jgi:hypothetical protein
MPRESDALWLVRGPEDVSRFVPIKWTTAERTMTPAEAFLKGVDRPPAIKERMTISFLMLSRTNTKSPSSYRKRLT